MAVTFAATQFACTEDAATNVASAERLLLQAVKKGAQVILLQELFETPYFCKDHLASHFELARTVEDSPVVRRFRDLAREFGVVVPLSMVERANNPQ
jgi:N-carbamoylputrescine amidase